LRRLQQAKVLRHHILCLYNDIVCLSQDIVCLYRHARSCACKIGRLDRVRVRLEGIPVRCERIGVLYLSPISIADISISHLEA